MNRGHGNGLRAAPGDRLLAGPGWPLWPEQATENAAMMTKEEERARMLARHDLVVSIIDLNSRQLRCASAKAGLDIERARAVRDAALPDAPAEAVEEVRAVERRMADIDEESRKLVKQREFVEAALRELDGQEPG
jgi:hypothetical protein